MKKGIILAGGYGSRLAPASSLINKHLLPVYSVANGAVPMLYYPIKTLKDAGIEDILIIVSRDRCGVMFETLGDGNDMGVELTYRVQEMQREPTGIAQALRLSENFVGDEKFAVILGDNFFEGNFKGSANSFREKSDADHARIFIKSVHDPERFGVAEVLDIQDSPGIGQEAFVKKIVEKPKEPKSNYAVTGLYFYTPHVFTLIPDLKPSNRGELEITDINQWYVENGKMNATLLNTFWHDMGTPEGITTVQTYLSLDKTKKI